MAKVLRLANYAQTTTYDFLTGNIKVSNDRWRPARTTPDRDGHYGRVTETMRLVSGATVANILAAEEDIDDIRSIVDLWRANPFEHQSGWLEYNANGESAKRAFLYSLAFYPAAEPGKDPTGSYNLQAWDLILERHPFWETPSTSTIVNTANTMWAASPEAISSTSGTVPSRIADLRVKRNSGTSTVTELWVGIREELLGTPNFDPLLELEDGSADTDTALASDAGGGVTDASPNGSTSNNILQCDFSSTTTLARRAYVKLSDSFAGNYDEWVGEYMVLLRCKVSAGTTCGVQLRWGMGATFIRNAEVYDVDNTSYMLIPLGKCRIPPHGHRAEYQSVSASNVLNFEFRIYAEVIVANGGTDTIDLDAIYLIPSRHMIYLEDLVLDNNEDFHVVVNEDDTIEGWGVNTGANPTRRIIPPSHVGWELPIDNSVMVMAAQRASTHALSEDLHFQLKAYTRWANHRTA